MSYYLGQNNCVENLKAWTDRFWSKVIHTKTCWIWVGQTDKDGYGKFSIGKHGSQKHYRAHRLGYFLWNDVIPDENKLVCHSCDNKRCVRGSHLFLGTQKDNILDAVKKNRHSILPGEKHPKAKLTEIEVKFIKTLKLSSRIIGMMFGVSKSCIDGIKYGYTWRHL